MTSDGEHEKIPGASYLRWVAPLVGVSAVVGLAAAVLGTWQRWADVRWLSSIPAASATPYDGPAIFTGRLWGPGERKSPAGAPAAAYWWAALGAGEEGDEVICSGRARTSLVLETEQGSLPIAWSNAPPAQVALITDEQTHEYGRPFTYDLGTTVSRPASVNLDQLCPHGADRYEEYLIPNGARAEVLGCMREHGIKDCDASLAGILAIPSLNEDKRHRIGSVFDAIRIVLIISLGLTGLAGALLWRTLNEHRRHLDGELKR